MTTIYSDTLPEALEQVGLPCPRIIEPGRLTRFPTNGKSNDTAGWLHLFEDGNGAAFGDWRTGTEFIWQKSDNQHIDTKTLTERRNNHDQARAATNLTRQAEYAAAAEHAVARWDEAIPATMEHGYLTQKGIKPHGTRQLGQHLIVPVYDNSDALQSLQLIAANGDKRFLPGGKMTGGRFWIGTPGNRLVLAEGFATAASIHEATNLPVVVCFTAYNLLAVAQDIRQRWPEADIFLAADNDVNTPGNPGRSKAEEAATAVNGTVVLPDIAGDWHDVYARSGPETVHQAFLATELWPEPLTLPKLPPVPDFSPEILPDDLAPWVEDAADRARFRPDFLAMAIMVALSTIVGRKIGIRLKQADDWTEHGNLWGIVVGSPSALKSPALREGLRALKSLQAKSDIEHNERLREHQNRAESKKIRRAARKKHAQKQLEKDPDADIPLDFTEEDDEEPTARTLWTSNVNEASLGELLRLNTNGILIERDEIGALLADLEREDKADLRGMLLSGWSGRESYRFDRILRGKIALPHFAISVMGGIQPGVIQRYVRSAFSGERADGLLQRLQLMCWPDSADFAYVDRNPDQKARQATIALFERVDALDPRTIGQIDEQNPDEVPFIRLSPEAQEIFKDWYTHFIQKRRQLEKEGEESPALAAHFGKYPGLLGKLALVLHVADCPNDRQVSKRTLLKALSWLQYLEPHAKRVYHTVDNPEIGAADLLVQRLKQGKLPKQFKAGDIARKNWQGLRDRDAVKRACRLLAEYDWLREIPSGPTGGRPADPVYVVNPKAEAGK